MIILKTNGQFAEFYERYDFSKPSNLCQLVWYTFLYMLILTVMGAVACLAIMGLIMIFIPIYSIFAIGVFFVVALFGSIIGFGIWIEKWKIKRMLLPERERPQWQANLSEAWRGWKEKYCPLVRFEDG